MSRNLNRRSFLKRSVAASAGAALGLGLEGRALPASADTVRDNTGGMPTGKIAKLRISRLISGGNVFSGWTHSRDLAYVSSLAKAYNTDEKAMATLEICEEQGINAIIAGSSRVLRRYWSERGGKIQWIAQTHPEPQDIKSNIQRAIDQGAAAAYVQGGIGDRWVKLGRVDLLGSCVDFIRKQGLPAGIGGHSLEVPMACEKAGIRPDFFMKTFHHDRYWSATPREQRVEFNVDTNSPTDHDNIWCIRPEETIQFMKKLEVPWIAFKVLAAGAIHPREGFRFAFENGADFICVGMFDFQVREDVILARKTLAGLRRERPWRA